MNINETKNQITMDFIDQMKHLGERVAKLKEQTHTEEATKTAFVMPFIQYLGYDVFNPSEVVPEFISDIGLKKGEKIDYAICKDGQPTILIECKHWEESLDLHDGQLLRYFHVSKAKFGILTNGIVYRFYTDLVEENKMDEKPFLEFNITEIKENEVEEVKKFHKSYFDIHSITNTASELKYTNELMILLNTELNNPSENFVRLFAKQIYSGAVTVKVLDQFTQLIKKSFNQLLSDIITKRLKSALAKENEKHEEERKSDELVEIAEKKIEPTKEEMEAFYIVKAILRNKVESSRIYFKENQSYLAVFIDNNRKSICRLYLNGAKKQIGIFGENKNEVRNDIISIEDLFKFSDVLISTCELYNKSKNEKEIIS